MADNDPRKGIEPSRYQYDQITLDEGVVSLAVPKNLSQQSFVEFESWLQVVVTRMRRLAEQYVPEDCPPVDSGDPRP